MVRFSGTRSCGDINYLKFLIRIFEFLQKCPSPLGLSLVFSGLENYTKTGSPGTTKQLFVFITNEMIHFQSDTYIFAGLYFFYYKNEILTCQSFQICFFLFRWNAKFSDKSCSVLIPQHFWNNFNSMHGSCMIMHGKKGIYNFLHGKKGIYNFLHGYTWSVNRGSACFLDSDQLVWAGKPKFHFCHSLMLFEM